MTLFMANGRIMTLRLRTKKPFSLVRSLSFIIVFGVRNKFRFSCMAFGIGRHWD
ncbi:hypothetical protein HanXRQr2_Chr03g0098911 [Helianthus annuus]|uniref:Uncharacterized protein n=1 Tax=Helianthus annuus TaxID=4232 RepID=A0A9K3JF52_HELAN|nr:hypothetical protein HanXRQr2_Chr03g0098911 [Helianthus annuus]